MPVPAWDELEQFTDPDDFGCWVVVTFQAGGTRRFPALFDDPAAGIEYVKRTPMSKPVALGDYDMDTEHPRLTATLARLDGVKRRDSVLIEADGKAYGVLTSPKPDGNGFATISLALET